MALTGLDSGLPEKAVSAAAGIETALAYIALNHFQDGVGEVFYIIYIFYNMHTFIFLL